MHGCGEMLGAPTDVRHDHVADAAISAVAGALRSRRGRIAYGFKLEGQAYPNQGCFIAFACVDAYDVNGSGADQ